MPSLAGKKYTLVLDDGTEVEDAFIQERTDGAWDVQIRVPSPVYDKPKTEAFIRADETDAGNLLLQAAVRVQQARAVMLAERQVITNLAASTPRDDRP